MDVILLERIEKLGQIGDEVSVKNGYGRNYLLPQAKVLRATKANRQQFEAQRAQIEARNLEQRQEAEAVKNKLDGQKFVLIRQASDGGNLYGSVTARDIVGVANEEGNFSIARSQVTLNQPVKELGLHDVEVVLHPEVKATITINVARSTDEAALQAEGKSIAQIRADEEAAEAEEFNIQSLFSEDDDINFDDDGDKKEEATQPDNQTDQDNS